MRDRPPIVMPACIKLTRFTAPKPLPYIKRGWIKGNLMRFMCRKNRTNDAADATMRVMKKGVLMSVVPSPK